MQSLNHHSKNPKHNKNHAHNTGFHKHFKEFSSSYKLQDVQIMMKELKHVAITTDNSTYDTGQKRSNVIHFHDSIVDLIIALYGYMNETSKLPKSN